MEKFFLQLLIKNKVRYQPVFYIHLNIIARHFSTFKNDFFYTQPTFVFHDWEDLYIVRDHILFFLQKDFDIFDETFFIPFFVFFDNT